MGIPNLLKQTRKRNGWSQEQAIVRFEKIGHALKIDVPSRSSLRTLFSMYENNRRDVPEPHRQIFCELYRVSERDLGLVAEVTTTAVTPLPALPQALPGTPSPEVITYLSNVLAEHTRADALLGPLYLVPAVQAQLPLIDRLVESTRGADRRQMLEVAAQFAEFCGWLYQDSGDPVCAMSWTNRALDYAQELADPQAMAYILMRKSNIATEAGHPGQGLGLANAALNTAPDLTPRLRAVSLRQLANAHALLAEPHEFESTIDHAIQHATEGLAQVATDKARYCTPAYVQMEAGMSWVLLGNPSAALSVFERSLTQWPEAAQTRDKGLCLARLATAAAAQGEIERAVDAGREALTIAQRTGSARIRAQLYALRDHLTPVAKLPLVKDLAEHLAQFTRHLA
jgi:tetratricopeptide (TPR) repeat protein